MKVPATQIVQFAFKELGLMVTVNQRLDFDQIELIASAFGFQAVREDEYAAEVETERPRRARSSWCRGRRSSPSWATSTTARPRCSTTSARPTSSPARRAASPSTSAPTTSTLPGDRTITFLDTPGHQAFTAMRARGAQVTDIVVLVVAADDQVMPQTIEAISHAKNAGVPMIVAINKIDLPDGQRAEGEAGPAAAQRRARGVRRHRALRRDLGQEGHRDRPPAGADPAAGRDPRPQGESRAARATAPCSRRRSIPGKGPLATILVQRGTLRGGDNFICGKFSGRVRALYDERGKTVKEAGPSIPVQILGLRGRAGGRRQLRRGHRRGRGARDRAEAPAARARGAEPPQRRRARRLEDFSRALKEGEVATLRIIIKADQGGPAEALADALAQLSTSEVRVDVVHRGVGAITESDILLAKASGAIVLGFHVRPDTNARAAAEREQVDVRTYRIIYEAVEDVRNALEGLLKPEERETVLGEAEVLAALQGEQGGHHRRAAWCAAASSSAPPRRGSSATASRCTPARSPASSASRTTCSEVREGLECGIGIENFNDLKVGDRIESFRMEEIKRTLAASAASAAGQGELAIARTTAMIVAIHTWELHLPACHSLKEKRGVLKPLTGGAAADAQRVGGGDRAPGSLAAGGDRLRGGRQRPGRSWRRPCAPPIGWSRRPTACGSWTP